MKYVKDILEIVLAFVIAWIFYQGLAFAAGTSMPIVSVVSESMEPVLHRGDLVFVVRPNDLKIGDIVIYQKACTSADAARGLCSREGDSTSIIHRIVQEAEGGYIIKGDNNPSPDSGIIRPEQVSGKVVLAMPLLGYPRLALFAVGI